MRYEEAITLLLKQKVNAASQRYKAQVERDLDKEEYFNRLMGAYQMGIDALRKEMINFYAYD